MAILKISSQNTGISAVTSGSLAFSPNVTAGDLLFVVYASDNGFASASPTILDTLGNLWALLIKFTSTNSVTNGWTHVFWAVAKSSGADTVSWTGGHANSGIAISEFSGVNSLDQLGAVLDTLPSGSGPHLMTSNPITTTVADELILLFDAGFWNSLTYGPVSPLTRLDDLTDAYSETFSQTGYQIVSSIQTGYTGVLSQANNAWGASLVLASFSFGTPPPPPSSSVPNVPTFWMG